MATKSQALITVSINGKSRGVWDTRSGGEVTASPTKYRPGGGQAQEIDSTRPTTGDVTVSRRFDNARDIELARELRPLVGRADITITDQPLDVDGVKFGKPTVYSGKLTGVNADDIDSTTDDVRMITLTASVKDPA